MATFSRETEGITVVKDLQQHVQGKTILITGASAKGLGAETAISLGHGKPAHLLLLARNASKVEPVIKEITSIDASIKTTFVSIELDKLDSVRKAASSIDAIVEKIDLFINNAGIMGVTKFTTNDAGLESQFATNHVGHFLLTNLLMDKILAAGKGARIVNLTSDGYMVSPFRFDDYNFSNGKEYDPWSGYGQSKTANILFTRELATRFEGRGIQSFAVHPGVIMDTNLSANVEPSSFGDINDVAIKNTGIPFKVGKPKTSQQGVSTTLVAALDPRIVADSGSYMTDCAVEEARVYATSAENAKKLWSISEGLVGQKFEF